MANSPIILEIASRSHRLSLFARKNEVIPFKYFSDMEQARNIPAHFNFTRQIRELNALVNQYVQNPSSLLSRGLRQNITSHSNQLNGALDFSRSDASLGDISNILTRVHQFALSRIGPAPALQAPPAQIADADIDIPDADQDAGADGLEDQNELDATIDNDMEEANSRRDQEIIHTRSSSLELVDSMVADLNTFNNPWRDAFEDLDCKLYDLFPGLLEGRLIQKSASYAAYRVASPSTTITEAEYNQIHAQSFQSLAAGIGRGFQHLDLHPLLIKLKTLGTGLRGQNDRLIYLGITRQEEIVRQQGLNLHALSPLELNNELTSAMESESVLFVRNAIENHLHRISKETLNQLTVWCASRGRLPLLSAILNARFAELSFDTFVNAMDEADVWENKSCYDALFNRYPHNKSGAPKALLLAFASKGIRGGLAHLLSADYPRGFTAATIDQAFNAALQNKRYFCFPSFFDAGVFPFNQTLNDAFDKLAAEHRFGDLVTFLRPNILSNIPNAGTILSRELKDLCEEDNLGYASFFIKPEVCALLDADSPIALAESILNNEALDQEESSPLLNQFFASPLFDRLTPAELYDLTADAAKGANTDFSMAMLTSRRSQEINKQQLEQIFLETATSRHWKTLLHLLDFPRYPSFSAQTMGNLLVQAVEAEELELVQKILSKEDPQDRISRDRLLEALRMAAEKNSTPLLREIFRGNLPLQPTVQELEPILTHCILNRKIDALFFLLQPHAALQIGPELLSQVLLEAAKTGQNLVFNRPFTHLPSVPSQIFHRAAVVALSNRHNALARHLLQARPVAVSPNILRECAAIAASVGSQDFLIYLWANFNLNYQILETAHDAAQVGGQTQLAVDLWHRIWHAYTAPT